MAILPTVQPWPWHWECAVLIAFPGASLRKVGFQIQVGSSPLVLWYVGTGDLSVLLH